MKAAPGVGIRGTGDQMLRRTVFVSMSFVLAMLSVGCPLPEEVGSAVEAVQSQVGSRGGDPADAGGHSEGQADDAENSHGEAGAPDDGTPQDPGVDGPPPGDDPADGGPDDGIS